MVPRQALMSQNLETLPILHSNDYHITTARSPYNPSGILSVLPQVQYSITKVSSHGYLHMAQILLTDFR